MFKEFNNAVDWAAWLCRVSRSHDIFLVKAPWENLEPISVINFSGCPADESGVIVPT